MSLTDIVTRSELEGSGFPLPGMDIRIVDDDGKELPKGEMGNCVLKTPLAPTFVRTLWKNPAKYKEYVIEMPRYTPSLIPEQSIL